MGFEPTIAAGERPYTYDIDHAATGTGYHTNEQFCEITINFTHFICF
jgi:hypothetical protein